METVGNLYDTSGYLNVPALFDYDTVFNFVVAGRGTGKSFGALKYIYDSGKTAVYLRRTQKQADIVSKAEFTPFKPIADLLGIDYVVDKVVPGVTALRTEGRTIFYTAALSTFASLRSFDMSDVSIIFYDEFIPETSEKAPIRHEYEAFLNMYETVNRNRELSGADPVKLFAAANANDINNKIFIGLGLVAVTDQMIKKGLEEWHDKKRSISLYYPAKSPVSEKKKDTALYRLADHTDFVRMAIQNSYNMDYSDIINRPQVEYKPVVNLGELCIRKHKARPEEYLITVGPAKGSAPNYPATERGILQFKEKFPRVVYYWLFGEHFYYQNLLSKSLFTTYMKEI